MHSPRLPIRSRSRIALPLALALVIALPGLPISSPSNVAKAHPPTEGPNRPRLHAQER